MTSRHNDRAALVLGAGGGLGSAVAVELARGAAEVVGWDVNDDALRAAADRVLSETGVVLHTITVDLGDPASIDAGMQSTRQFVGNPDILVNITGGPPPSSVVDVERAVWLHHFQSMVLSVIQVTDLVVPGMREKGWGRVITSTSSGVVAPIPNLGLSNSLRSCLVGWSKTLSNEIGADGITVNTVIPGRVATQRIQQLDEARSQREGKDVASVRDASIATIPAGRYGEPREFADVVAFLASDAASFINGSSIRIDGGMIPSIA